MKWLRQLFDLLREELDLVATFAVVCALLSVEFIRPADSGWTEAAIVVALLGLVVGSFRMRQRLSLLSEQFARAYAGDPGVEWFKTRDAATPEFREELVKHECLVFVGSSHSNLAQFLTGRIGSAIGPLPWKRIEVYYCAPEILQSSKSESAGAEIRESREQVAALLTNPLYRDKIPQLAAICFFHNERPLGFSGSMLGRLQSRPGAAPSTLEAAEFSCMYIVHPHPVFEKGLTLKLRRGLSLGRAELREMLLDHYQQAYGALKRSSRSLGAFRFSVWDMSAEAWSKYAARAFALRPSMKHLVDMVELREHETAMELGSGSGETSHYLVTTVTAKGGSVLLVDGSPQMTAKASENLGRAGAKFYSREVDEDTGDLPDAGYSLIVIHQSLQELIATFGGLDSLAGWCSRKLKRGGRVALAAHDQVVELAPPEGFGDWKDPFREALYDRLRLEDRGWVPPASKARIHPTEIESTFRRFGFGHFHRETMNIELTMSERCRMWTIPAIMNSVVDVGRLGADKISAIVHDVELRVGSKPTKPRVTAFWIIGKSDD